MAGEADEVKRLEQALLQLRLDYADAVKRETAAESDVKTFRDQITNCIRTLNAAQEARSEAQLKEQHRLKELVLLAENQRTLAIQTDFSTFVRIDFGDNDERLVIQGQGLKLKAVLLTSDGGEVSRDL